MYTRVARSWIIAFHERRRVIRCRASARLRGKSAMIRRSIIDPYRRIVVGMGATPPAKLDFHAANAITRSSARRCSGERELERRAFKRRVTIITRPQFIIQTLCTGSRRISPSTLIPSTLNRRQTDRSKRHRFVTRFVLTFDHERLFLPMSFSFLSLRPIFSISLIVARDEEVRAIV